MKQTPIVTFPRYTYIGWLVLAIFVVSFSAQADQTKANNDDNLEVGASWVSGNAPGSGDNAIWGSTVATPANCTNTLGAAATWGGIIINSPAAPVAIKGSTTLTLDGGINMAEATVNLDVDCGTITLAGNQTWTVASGLALTTGSSTTLGRVQNNTITLAGGGTWTTSGTDDNGSLGIIVESGTVNLNKSPGSGHSVGGPGLTIYTNGTARITGSGGGQIYSPANVTINGGIFDLDGQAQTINNLNFNSGTLMNSSGSGSLGLTGGVVMGGTNCVFDVAGGSSLSITGAISGSYPLIKIDSGTLTLSGTNTYNGTTTISAGGLEGVAGGSCANSAVSVGTGATNGVLFAGGTSQWTCGSLVYGAGTTYANFNFGANLPSLTVAPLQVNGNLTLNGTLNFIISGSAIPSGSYPLIKYSGTLTGSLPSSVFSLPAGVAAVIVNDTANQSVDLNVTTGNIVNQITWGVGNGVWDVNTTSNWNNAINHPAVYQNADGVIFNDTASGNSPIAITLNTTVSPANVTANNSAKTYMISGSGAISGTCGLTVQGGGVLTLATANTYNGGTTLASGQLNINNGGTSSGNSAIGTGTLTITSGTIDDTGGADVALAPNNAQNWNGSFTYAGSVHNLNLGTGTVNVGANLTLTVISNTLTTGGHVNNNTITKAGGGTWTIGGGNSTDNSGLGIIINGGTVNFNKSDNGSHCVGGGGLVINSGTARITGTGGDQIYNGASVTMNSGLFDLYGHAETVAGLAGNGTVDNTAAGTSAALTISGNNGSIITGTLQNSGSGALLGLIVSGGGAVTLTGFNTHAGGTTISGGTLYLGLATDTAALVSPVGTGPVTNNASLVMSSSQSVTISNVIKGAGSVTVSSPTAVLLGGNTYTGTTTISPGCALQLAGTGSIADSSVISIGSDAEFDVSGLAAPFTLGASETLMGSGATGLLVGDVNLSAGSLVLDFTSGTPVLSVDDGTLTLNNNHTTVTVAGATPLGEGSYQLISLEPLGDIAGSVASATVMVNGAGLAANMKAALQMNGEGLYLNVSPVTANIVTATVLGSSANPSAYESSVVFTATVTPVPTNGELVTFSAGATVIATAPISNGIATCDYSALWFGAHSITASYAGDAKYQPSATSLSQTVTAFPTTGPSPSVAVSNSGMTVNYGGVAGYLYDVQRSTNLINWVTIATAVKASSNGVVQFTDPNPPQPSAFYQLMWNQTYSSVPAADVTLEPVVADNLPLITYITAYDVNEQTVANAAPAGQQPLYYPYNSWSMSNNVVVESPSNDQWWDNLVAEQLQARLPVVMLSTCGAYTTNLTDLSGPGSMNPRRLPFWLAAVQRAGATNAFQTACFAEAAAQGIYDSYYNLPGSALCDFANTDSWNQVWWLRIIKPWFDNVPSNTWYHVPGPGGGVPVEFWGLNITSIYTNSQGNVSRLFTFLANKLQATYGISPCYILGSINSADATLTNNPYMLGDNEWFGPPNTPYTMTPYKGHIWGGGIAGYINPGYYTAGNSALGNVSTIVTRNGFPADGVSGGNGDTLIDMLSAAVNANAFYTVIEGYDDVSESCGPYRSLSTNWDYPNQYLDTVRSFTDLRTVTLQLQAEGCDQYANATGNPGGVYRRTGTLGIRLLAGGGWAVTGTVAGEWIQFTNLVFSPGNYKFSVRYSAVAAQVLQLYVDGVAQPAVTVPATDDMDVFNILSLGTGPLAYGNHTFRLVWVDGGVDVDWLFIKKYDPLMAFQSSVNGTHLTANSGGNGALAATNSLPAGNWEQFSMDDLTGNGTVTNGDSLDLQAYDGLYVTAVSGGGGQILAEQRVPGSNELFSIVKLNGGGALTTGDSVALRTHNGNYVTVQPNGTVDATGTTVGTAQTFIITVSSQ